MTQYSGNFASLVDLDPVLEELFFQQYPQIPMVLAGAVMGIRTSAKSKETAQRVGSFGEPQPWQGQVYYDEADADYDISFTHEQYTLGFKIERTMLEDLQYEGIFDRAANLGQALARKRVRDEASIFNNAFSASHLGYDSKALCAADHPRSESDSTAVSNYLGTLALTEANLETAIQTLEALGDDRGQETNAMATHLIVGRANRQKALQLTGSPLNPESGNNAINTNSGMTVIVHPMISSKKWFVVDGALALRTIKWYDRLLPEFSVGDDATNTLVRSYVGRMRYSFGWTDFRAVVGSNAS